jgi:ribosomal protein L7Ae-like RNA K-turn-binding protein
LDDKFLLILGMALRANKIAFRNEVVCDEIMMKHARIVLAASDVYNIKAHRIYTLCQEYQTVFYQTPYSKLDLGYALGRGKTEFISVKDKGFTKKILEMATTIGGLILNDYKI